MEAVPRMPMIWLDLKEAGEFQFSTSVKQFILKNYGEDPDSYNEQLKKLEQLRQSAVNVTRDFEGCSTLRKYFGQLHYLQSRVPMGPGQEAAVPISWTEIFSGKTVSHDDISYEQACILYNLGALHSMLGAMDNRVSEEGMKVSCTHFQCSAGAFSYLRDHFSHNFSVDMSHQILNLNINLMLGQAQECLLEKSMLDNRKSFLVARISAQVVDYYKEACRALENSETASMLGKIQKDWKKLVQMKIYYFAAIAHLHMGKQAEEQQKFGERLAYLQSSIDKLSEALKLAKGQPDSVQEALKFTMDVIGGKFNSAKKDNDFVYHETVPSLETLPSVKGAPLVKALPVNPTDPTVTGPDIFSKLVPMAAHEASSLYSEEKAKLLRELVAKIDGKNETLEQFMDSVSLDPDSVDNMDMYNTIPPVLMEKCAALSVRPDTVKSLIQSMQALSGVFTDVEASLREIRDVLEKDEAEERSLQEVAGKQAVPPQPAGLAELRRDLEKYLEYHEKASFTNTELHRAMNLHISHLRLLGGPLDSLREALPRPELSEEDAAGLQCIKRILGKVQEMRDQRVSLEKQLRDLIQQDDITTALVTTELASHCPIGAVRTHALPHNLPPPELLARISRLPTPGYPQSLPPGRHPHQLPQYSMPQAPASQPPAVSAYAPQHSQAHMGPPVAPGHATAQAPVRPSTTTVDSIQTPIPSYAPTPGQPMPQAPGPHQPVSVGYTPGPQMGSYHQYMQQQQPGVPQGMPPQQQQQQQQHFPQAPSSIPGHQPPHYQPVPAQQPVSRPMPGPQVPMQSQGQYHQYMPQQRQPGPPNFPQAYLPGQVPPGMPTGAPSPQSHPHHGQPQLQQGYPPVSMVPGSHPTQVPVSAVAQNQMPPHGPHPQVPPTSQPMPPASMPYLPHVRQQMPPASQPYMPTVNPQMPHSQHPQMPLPSQQMPLGPHMQMPPGSQSRMAPPNAQLPPTSQPMPPVSHSQMLPVSKQLSPPSHPQMPPGPQQPPHPAHPNQMPPQPLHPPTFQQTHLPRGPQVQMSPASMPSQPPMHPNALPPQRHSHPQGVPQTHPQMPPHVAQQPMRMPHQPLPPHTGPMGYPGAPYMIHQQGPPASSQQAQPQPLTPQPMAPQPLAPQSMPQPPPASFAPSHGGNVPPGPVQHPSAVGSGPAPQNMIPPIPPSTGAVGAQAPNVLPSPAPSPSPSPGPPSLGMNPQRPSPALTPVGVTPLPQTLSSSTSSSSSSSSSGHASDPLFQRQNSSTDDLLSSSPESQHGGAKDNVLLPTKADPQEDGQRRKKSEAVRLIEGDPYQAPERMLRLCAELERFRATVQSLEHPTGEGGLSELDARWKELQDQQEKDARQLSIAIARCYTMKNRHQDIMPYDRNRVVLRSGKDDYINASFIEDLSPYCPRLIATQAPLTGTAADFWLMVYEQKVSLVVMLVSEQELEKQKVLPYFPSERGQQLSQGPITLTLTTQKTTPTHVERMISLQYRDQSLKRTVIHLQFTSWPELGLPDSKSNLIRFIQEVHGHFLHQRPLHTPVVVHCSSGVGRTGALCLLYAALQEVEAGNGIPDMILLVRKMRQQRKNMLQEKLHLKFCYEAVLKHAEQVLQRHGVAAIPCSKTVNNAAIKPYSRQESQDIVLGGDLPISSIQATIAKLSIRPQSGSDSEQESSLDLYPSAPADLSLQVAPECPNDAALHDPFPSEPQPSSFSPPPSVSSSSSSPAKVQSPSPLANQGNGFVEPSPGSPTSNHHTAPALDPSGTASPPPGPTSSSLDLLASMTAEAFTLDAACRGKPRINKQSFLQPQEGQGLQGPPQGDDPLSNLDPLWTLNKT
ncbi:hypothetical protein AALO_G00183710 [Alosa alosa]|uniref:Tyrosine-protein phosphatase non-receptor type 23 n=1 Tax=Alosa alosa TaxID=278164 RepID=A0AAV6G9F0_9TELE|nr:hypothetical protein AALO_G00183710 [Alosa alosa]